MRTKLAILICLVLMPFAALGQFDFGPGGPSSASSSVSPWKEKPFKLNPKTRIKLDFQNASIDAIVKFFSEHSGITVVKDPALTGTLNISSAKAVSLADAFSILQATLNLKNYEIAKQDNLLIIRQRDGGQGRNSNNSNPFGSLTPEMIASFTTGNTNLKVYPITYANASQVARVINDVFASATDPMSMLQQMMGGGQQGGRNQGGRNQGGRTQGFQFGGRGGFGMGNQPSVKASYDDFSNAVIVNAPNNMQEQVHDLILKIDKKTDDPQKSKVFKMNFALADDLVSVVQNVLNSTAPRGRGGATTQQQQGPQAFINAIRGTNAGSGTVVSEPRTNSLIVTATQENLDIVAKLIPELDVDVKYENAAFVLPLNNAKADVIATLLQQAWGTKTGAGGQTNRAPTNTSTRPNTTTNTGNRNNAGGGGNGGRLGGSLPPQETAVKDADGKNWDLALENPDDDSGELYTSIGVQQGGGFRQILGGGQGNRTGATPQTGRNAQGQLVNVRDLTNQITVIPDINTNSLIVVGTPDQADLVRSIVEQLDKIPEQVMIETIIVEANLDATDKLGIEWKYLDKHNNAEQTYGLRTNTTNPPQGLLYTWTGNLLSGFLNTIRTDSNFSILSTPRIFTSNNVQADINISQSIPYVLSTIQDANGNLSFNYAFQDVGIVLTVTPRITSNGYVTLDVTQTANDLQGYTSFNAPIVNKREADTTVSVKDGETIILGGIIRNTVTTTSNKIPILGDIPLLGNLFKSSTKQKVKTELMVLLTPHVVANPDDARKLREREVKQLSPGTQKVIGTIDGPKTDAPPPVKRDGGGTK